MGLGAFEYLLREREDVGARGIDQVPAAHLGGASVGNRGRQRCRRLVELRGRVGRGDQQHRLGNRRERTGVRRKPPVARKLREDRRAVARERSRTSSGNERQASCPPTSVISASPSAWTPSRAATARIRSAKASTQAAAAGAISREPSGSSPTTARTRSGWRSARSIAIVPP